MGDDNPAVYLTLRSDGNEMVIYRASALGSCIRSLVAFRKGIQPNATSDKMQGYYDEGKGREEEILDRFHDKIGKGQWERVGGQGEIQLRCGSIDGRELWVVGHYDEEIANRTTGEMALVEAKFLAQSSFRNINFSLPEPLAKFPYYAWQRDAYMVAKKCPLMFVVGIKERDDDKNAVLVDVVWSKFEKPVNSLVGIIKRVRRIEELASGDLPDCDFHQFPCAFYGSVCAGQAYSERLKGEKEKNRTESGITVPDEYKEVFDKMCADYEYGSVLSRDGEARKEQIVREMKALWEDMGVVPDNGQEVTGNRWKIEWVKYPRKGNVDWKKVPEEIKKEIEQYRGKEVPVAYPKIKVAATNVGQEIGGGDLKWKNDDDPQRKLDYVDRDLAERLAPNRKTTVVVSKYKGQGSK